MFFYGMKLALMKFYAIWNHFAKRLIYNSIVVSKHDLVVKKIFFLIKRIKKFVEVEICITFALA